MKSKVLKRQEALERQKEYDKLTIQERLDRLDKGGFVAVKERKRLEGLR